MDPQLSPVRRPSTRWAGGRAPLLASLVIVFGAVVGLRAFASTPATTAGTAAASPSKVPGGESSPQVGSPGPDAVGQPRLITPKVDRVGALDELKPLQAASFPLGELVSVSPDGRYALVWIATPDMIRARDADVVAIPLTRGDPINLGTAGYERTAPEDSEDRLVTPVWSSDSSRVAYVDRAGGVIVALEGGSREAIGARAGTTVTPVIGGGFVIIRPSGPTAVGGARFSPVAPPPGLDPLGYLADGTALAAVDARGGLVWTDGIDTRTISPSLGDRGWRVFARSGDTLLVAPEGRRLDRGVFVVSGKGPALELALPDGCGIPDVSDDGAYAAYTVCDHSGSAESYGIRLVRLADGAAVDFGNAAVSPRFVPGTHRLAWLALSGNPPIDPMYTVSFATNEVLP